jgi:hypothetical protein
MKAPGCVFDIEADGLKPTKIHCVSVNSGGKISSTAKYAKMKSFFTKAEILVAHNCKRYDIPNLERLLDIKITARVVDTLALSWYLEPTIRLHGLAQWGEHFGVPKPVVEDWDNLPVEEYIHRCEEDVKINTLLWEQQWKQLLRLYGTPEKAWKLIDYLTFKMDCAAEQEKHKWKLNVPHCEEVLKKLTADWDSKTEELKGLMPSPPVIAKKTRPKKPFKQDGTVSSLGEAWFALLKQEGLPEDYDGVVDVITGYVEPKPGSHDQIKSWLYSLGWVPTTFKYVRDKVTGDVRQIPQVQQDKAKGPGLCNSVKKLYPKEPGLVVLDGLSILTHRKGILSGFLNNVDDDGYVQAQVQGLTNTLRFKHSVVVNLPGIDKPYGADIRGCLVAPEGYELLGSDMSSLEDRTKQHYMWVHDPEYVKEMIVPDFDPHLNLAEFAKELTKERVLAYKEGALSPEEMKLVKAVRSVYKGANYSCVYGVGSETLSRTIGCGKDKASKLIDTYWKRNWSVKAIAEEQIVKTCNKGQWLYNPVSELWYSLRYEKDRFSTLNQGTGVWCFDEWVANVRKDGPPIIGQMHDEIIALVKRGNRGRVTEHIRNAMLVTNQKLKLNRELDCSIQFGDSYADIH